MKLEHLNWLSQYTDFHKDATSQLRETTHLGPKFLVYVCEDSCGGLGDRISGIVSSFYLAVSMERVFYIEYTNPVPLEETLRSKTISWHMGKYIPKFLPAVTVNLMDGKYMGSKVRELERLHNEGTAVIRLRVNRYWLGMLLWSNVDVNKHSSEHLRGAMKMRHTTFGSPEALQSHAPAHTFAFGYDILFAFSKGVENRLIQLYRDLELDPNRPFVGIHARIGGQVTSGDSSVAWNDPQRHNLDEFPSFVRCARAKQSAINYKGGDISVVLISDSTVLKRSPLLLMENIRHTDSVLVYHVDRSDRNHQNASIGNLDAFAELALLSNAKCIVASMSSFSGLASVMHYPPVDCFGFHTQCTENVDFWNVTEVSDSR